MMIVRSKKWWRASVLTTSLAATMALVAPAAGTPNAAHKAAVGRQVAASSGSLPSISNGPGYTVPAGARLHGKTHENHAHLGLYEMAGHSWVCYIDYDKFLTEGQKWKVINTIPHLSQTVKEEIFYTLSVWGSTASNNRGAADNVVVRLLAGNKDFKFDWVHTYQPWFKSHHPVVLTMVHNMLQQAHQNHGPDTLTKSVTPAHVTPGDHATATFVVKSATGHGLKGQPVSLKFNTNAKSQGKLPKVSGNGGVFKVHFTASGIGRAGVKAKVSQLPDSTTGLLSQPHKGQQRLISSQLKSTSVSATVHVSSRPVRPNFSYKCTANCDGNPASTATFPKLKVDAKYYKYVNGKLVKTIKVPANTAGAKFVSHDKDGTKVTFGARYLVNGKWTHEFRFAHVWKIDCPPLPKVTFSGSCDCTSNSVTFSLPTNTTSHIERLVLTASDGTNETDTAKPGQTASINFKHTPGSSVTVTVSAGIQRGNGQWHNGNKYSVVLP